MKAEEVQKAVTATQTVPIKEKTKAIVPQVSQAKETKYCTLLQSTKITDKDGLGYTYAFEKIYVKELEREEVRICLYKDMRDRSGKIQNRMLVRPCDLTEMEFIQLFDKAIKDKLFSDEFVNYLRNIVNQK